MLTGRGEDMGQLGGELGLQGREYWQKRKNWQWREDLQGREDWQGDGNNEERHTGEQFIMDPSTDDESEEEDLVGSENQGTIDFSDEYIKGESMTTTQSSIERIESGSFEELGKNYAPKRYKRDIKEPLKAQPKYVAPGFDNSKLKTKVQVESTDLESSLEVKLQGERLQFELETAGLKLFEQTRRRCVAAAEAFMSGKVKSLAMAAEYFNINVHTLKRGLKRGHFNKRPGIPTKVFTPEEEKKLAAYIKSLDFEVTWKQIGLAIQEALLEVTKSNPERKTGMENTGQVPCRSWVQRFADRNGLQPIKSIHCKTDDPGRYAKWQKINYKVNKLYTN